MQYLNLELANISITDLIAKSKDVSEKMNGNPHFINPYPSLREIEDLTTSLEKLNSEVDNGSINLFLNLQDKFKSLKKKLSQLGTFVAIKAQGNAEVAVTSGFKVSERLSSNQDHVISL